MEDPDRKDEPRPGRSGASDDQIEALLRATGRRPAVPVERAERVKATVRVHWRAETGRRTRRRRVWAAAAVASAAMVVVALGLGVWQRVARPPAGGPVARIEIVSSAAWLRPASAEPGAPPAALRPGDEVGSASELATEEGARLAMRLRSGHSVRIDEGTRLRVLSDRVIELDRGAVYIDSRGPLGAARGSVEIRTRFGRIRDIGTQFEARLLDAALRVRVREGAITLDGGDSPLAVQAGYELQIDEDGRIAQRELAAFGAEWAWIAEITPMMSLEGRRLREFLDWLARERGLHLRFASAGLAESASETVLNGSIAGMTLDQALDSVLPTCRMRHRIEKDVLVVERLAESAGAS